jgi:hypothetical protein
MAIPKHTKGKLALVAKNKKATAQIEDRGAYCCSCAGFCTISGRGWNVILRLHSTLEPFFDKTWRPSEIELVK